MYLTRDQYRFTTLTFFFYNVRSANGHIPLAIKEMLKTRSQGCIDEENNSIFPENANDNKEIQKP